MPSVLVTREGTPILAPSTLDARSTANDPSHWRLGSFALWTVVTRRLDATGHVVEDGLDLEGIGSS